MPKILTTESKAALISFLADADGRKMELWQHNRDENSTIARMLHNWKALSEAYEIPPFADESQVFRCL